MENEELTDLDREQIADLIKEGFSSGIVDSEDYRISWELKADKFSTE